MTADGTDHQKIATFKNGLFLWLGPQLWTSRGVVPVWGSAILDDVPNDHWANLPVGWAVANNIVERVAPNRFDLNKVATRSQIVAFIYRLHQHLG